MHIAKENLKYVKAHHLGESDARTNKPFNVRKMRSLEKRAYKSGYIYGQKFRKSEKV